VPEATITSLTRQDVASAYASATGQRVVALSGDGKKALEDFRAGVVSDGTVEQHEMGERVRSFVARVKAMTTHNACPGGVPSAVMGHRMAERGAVGSGDGWKGGPGMEALVKLLDTSVDPEVFPPSTHNRFSGILRRNA